MTPNYSKIHNRFKLNGFNLNQEGLVQVAYNYIKEGDQYQVELGEFILDWVDNKPFVKVKTSGSTGTPKIIKLDKQAMVNSAIATGDFFGLEPGNKALHCLPTNYIAGKMMVVRAIVLGLELDVVTPSAFPLDFAKGYYNICAMVPFQLKNALIELNRIEKLLIGGSAAPKYLIDELQQTSCKIFETYGMTETITHIAARPLNHNNGYKTTPFQVFPNVTIESDERNCLVVSADYLNIENVVSNDIVKIVDTNQFELVGRYDNVINSGGVKLIPEQIEKKLEEVIDNRFFITSMKNKELGEIAVLLVEDKSENLEKITNAVKRLESLDRFEIPKNVYVVPKFIETESGKIQRKKTLGLLK